MKSRDKTIAAFLFLYSRVALLQGSTCGRNAPYPIWNSVGALEIRAAKFGHLIKNPDAILHLGFLILEVARFELAPDS
jgi:hypothetical protein